MMDLTRRTLLDHDRGVYFLIVSWVLYTTLALVVCVRIFSRTFITRSIGSDDITIILPVILMGFGSVSDTIAVHYGLGRHENTMSNTQYQTALQWIYISWIVAFLSFFFIRASVMLFTLRLLPLTKMWSQRIIYVTLVLNFAITLAATASYGVRCSPSKPVPASVLLITMQVNGILACVIDVTTAAIPFLLLWKLDIKRTTKIQLDIIFGLGLITAGLSIGRAVSVNYGALEFDTTWRILPASTFNTVESHCGVILASCPALRQLWTYYHRTGKLTPTASRQTPNSDFGSMRHRVRLRDLFWRGHQDPARAQGLPLGGTDGKIGTGIEDSPLSSGERRVHRWFKKGVMELSSQSSSKGVESA